MALLLMSSPAQRSHSNKGLDLGFEPSPTSMDLSGELTACLAPDLGGTRSGQNPCGLPACPLSFPPVLWLALKLASERASSCPMPPPWGGIAC